MQLPSPLNELALPGLTALFLIATAWREARKAKAEVLKAPPVAPNPIISAVSMAWDRDQQERFLQFMERIAVALETTQKATDKVARAQEALADQQKAELKDHIEELLDQMKTMKTPNR